MAAYSFTGLSPYEFEDLCRDLFQEHLDLQLESFAAGADAGIDLRHLRSPTDRGLILQCKHFAGSTYSTLKSKLKQEVPKLDRLRPREYRVITSVSLTPHRKSEIKTLLRPYVRSVNHVYGSDDIN